MELTVVADSVGNEVEELVEYILNQNWTDDAKRKALTRVFKMTGVSFYDKTFLMSSELFDSTALGTLGYSNPEDQCERIAYKVVQNHNLTRSNKTVTIEFFYSVLSMSGQESFKNAKSLGKHPTIKRTPVIGACKWCISMSGTFTDPDGSVFRHHENCRCLFTVKGFNTRNGKYIGHVPNRHE